MKVTPLWKRFTTSVVCFLLHAHFASSQTTTLPTTTITDVNTPEFSTQTTTTFVPTLTPLFTTEGTTLATADSASPTTAVPTEEATAEATTEGQASNDALRTSGPRRGYRFESTRSSRPNDNQETEQETETQATTTQKPEEKKIAWKFGRGGNNQEPWSSRPSPNGGFPVWKKETPAPDVEVEQSTEAVKTNENDQAYIVWSVGQGNQPNGWTLAGADADGWAPGGVVPVNSGWAPADASVQNNPESAGWNAEGWSQDQSVENDEAQGWTNDDVASAPNEESPPSLDSSGEGGWNPQNPNAGGWVNVPGQAPPPGVQPSPNSWQPQGNDGNGGAWIINPQQQGNNGQVGWLAPQQDGGWDAQLQQQGGGGGGWINNGEGWVQPPGPTNSWQNTGPTQPGGWNSGQQNPGGWNAGNGGSPGWQDGNLSWKVYNEDTQTMENLDDNSGWKVVGDGGPDGWKLIDENGKVEWKIENINGEWKVTSADEFSSTNDTTASTPSDSVNATTEATNDTSTETTTLTSNPSGGWDDDKQGRYIIWKFSEDGKGEARVYGGPGSDPEVWTVGDNNEWWKETMGVKKANTVVKGGYNTGDGNRQANGGGWRNAVPQAGNIYQNDGGPAQNVRWQSGGGAQSGGTNWQQNRQQVVRGGAWRNNGPSPPSGGNAWQTGGSQRGSNRWQNRGNPGTQQKWNNGASPPQTRNRWQNQPTQPANWNAGNVAPPAASGWQNAGPQPRPQGGNWQRKPKPQQPDWQNGATRNAGGWRNGGQAGGRKAKGRWRNNGNRPSGRWASNNANGSPRSGTPKGRVWNSGNGWRTTPNVQPQEKPGWVTNPPSTTGKPPVTAPTTSARLTQNDQNKSPQSTRWSENSRRGQTVPYIIVIKAPDTSTTGTTSSPLTEESNRTPATKQSQISNAVNTRPQSNRRNGGWKMNRAGSSGWQWNPQGGSEGWQWRDGWMGSGGGFGGWSNEKGTMYSNWRPTRVNKAQPRNSASPRSDRGNKKTASKMVFVFGTKRRTSGDTSAQPINKGKKGKQVIIIDYTSGGKTPPKGDEGMKKDIESVIQALKTAKPTGVRGTTLWKSPAQKRKQQQWSRR